MTIFEMLFQSLILTVVGMAVVFAFLWIMIVCINMVGKLIHSAGLDKDALQAEGEIPRKADGAVKQETVAVISAAVTEYRKNP